MNGLNAAVIVAHPDDETLWAGGMMLCHPEWRWFVACLCRANDPDRAPRFQRALRRLRAEGAMGDLDDGPAQEPLAPGEVAQAVTALVPSMQFDIAITHGPDGEYTRHRRHEETAGAVAGLWREGRLSARELWMFAYDDDGGRTLPRAASDAHLLLPLPRTAYLIKRRIITGIYGFAPESFEAQAAPRAEAFRRFCSPAALHMWSAQRGDRDETVASV